MKVDYKKMILTTALFTLAVIVVVGTIISLLMVFVFTKQSADFFYGLGCDGVASSLYHRVYEQNNDIYYCYKSLNLEIKEGNGHNIVKYYEQFTSDDEYVSFMNKLKLSNDIVTIPVLEKSTIINEENYLSNKYISALISINESSKAFDFALEMFNEIDSGDLKNQGVYGFYHFISNESSDADVLEFSKKYENSELKLYEEMQEYYNQAIILFNLNKDSDNNLDKAYVVSLGNRIITLGSNLNTIYHKLNLSQDKIESNSITMQEINTVIKGIIQK